MLQFTNDDPNQHRKYSRSHLILPCGAQYNDRLFPMILKSQNHQEPLMDSSTKEPFPMELVGDFQVADPIFKGCYGDSLLYSDVDLHWLRGQGIHLPAYWGEIPVPPAPLYWQAREPKVMKQSPSRVVTPNLSMESPKTKHSSGKGGPTTAWDTAPTPQLQSAQTPLQPRSPSVPKSQPRTARRSLPGLMALASAGIPLPHLLSQSDPNGKMFTQKTPAHSTPPFPSAAACLMASAVQLAPTAMVTELLPPFITLTPLGLAGPRQW